MRRLFTILAGTLILFALANLAVDGLLKAGLRRYYCLAPADTLVIGHSMSEMGIDPLALEKATGLSVAKYCMNGAGTKDRLVMLQHYLETTRHKPKFVLYDVSARSFSSGLATNSYTLFYPFLGESQAVSHYIRQHAPKKDFWRKRLIPLTRYEDTHLGAVLRGYRQDWTNHTLKMFSPEEFRRKIEEGDFWKITFEEENMRCFEETLAFLGHQGIPCLLLALPSVDMLNSAEPEKYAKSMAFLQEKAEQFPLVHFVDLNQEYETDHGLFADPIHLNPKGQEVITKAIANLLNSPTCPFR